MLKSLLLGWKIIVSLYLRDALTTDEIWQFQFYDDSRAFIDNVKVTEPEMGCF